MSRHRTTARGVTFLLTLCGLAVAAACASAAPATSSARPQLVFPVLGPVIYTDDFGDARGSSRHEGNDIMAPRRAIAVAAEAGIVKFWTTSANAGCMLYLDGDSGTSYWYIHLNNDLGPGNDNKGKCVAGTAYAAGLKSGDRVEAGQAIGFVGDSGDADGISPHLHFEVHPKRGAAVNPYRALQKAKRLLFSEPDGKTFTLVLDGTVVAAAEGALTLKLESLRQWPSHQHQEKVDRTLTVTVADARAAPGDRVRVWTGPQATTPEARAGVAGAISVVKLLLR